MWNGEVELEKKKYARLQKERSSIIVIWEFQKLDNKVFPNPKKYVPIIARTTLFAIARIVH